MRTLNKEICKTKCLNILHLIYYLIICLLSLTAQLQNVQ